MTLAPASGGEATEAAVSADLSAPPTADAPASATTAAQSPRYGSRPAESATQQAASTSAETPQLVEKTYPWNDSTRNVLSAWQQISQQRSDIRITFDGAHAQARVFASPTVHAQLQQQLAQVQSSAIAPKAAADAKPAAPAAIAANDSAPANEAGGQPTTASLVLKHLPPAELKPRLEKVLAQPLVAGSDASGQWQLLNIESPSGNRITLAVNSGTREVRLAGSAMQVANWRTVVETLDSGPSADGTVAEVVATKPRYEPYVRQALSNLQIGGAAVEGTAAVASMLFQAQPGGAIQPGITPPQPAGGQVVIPPGGETQAVGGTPGALSTLQAAQNQGLLGPVQISYLEGANLVIIRGREQDVQRVLQIIEQIEKITQTSAAEDRRAPIAIRR